MGKILLLGDSIMLGKWLANGERDGIAARLADRFRKAGDTREVANYAVGGSVLDPASPNCVAAQVVTAAESGDTFDAAYVAAGTNDLVSHSEASAGATRWGAIAVDVALQQAGVTRRLWATVLPRGPHDAATAAQPPSWLPTLTARCKSHNDWMRAMWGPKGQLVDLAGVLGEGPDGLLPAVLSGFLLSDGLHPTRYGCLDVADAIPIGRFG